MSNIQQAGTLEKQREELFDGMVYTILERDRSIMDDLDLPTLTYYVIHRNLPETPKDDEVVAVHIKNDAHRRLMQEALETAHYATYRHDETWYSTQHAGLKENMIPLPPEIVPSPLSKTGFTILYAK